MQWLQQNIQVVFFVVFILISAISSIATKIKEQKTREDAKQRTLQRAQDLPRSQTPPPPAQSQQQVLQRAEETRPGPANPVFETERSMPTEEDARRRLRDLAERRRGELQELARRSQKGGLSGVGGTGGTPGVGTPRPVIIVDTSGQQPVVRVQRPAPTQTRPQTSRGSPDPRKKPKPDAQKQRMLSKDRERESAAYAAATGADFGESTTTRLVADSPAIPVASPRANVGAGLFTAESLRLGTAPATGGGGGAMQELRRSFALVELLRPPLSLRSPDQEPLSLPSGAPTPPGSV